MEKLKELFVKIFRTENRPDRHLDKILADDTEFECQKITRSHRQKKVTHNLGTNKINSEQKLSIKKIERISSRGSIIVIRTVDHC